MKRSDKFSEVQNQSARQAVKQLEDSAGLFDEEKKAVRRLRKHGFMQQRSGVLEQVEYQSFELKQDSKAVSRRRPKTVIPLRSIQEENKSS